MMNSRAKGFSMTQKNLWLDVGLFVFVLLVCAPQATGLAVHEWLSLAFVVPVIVHLLWHWRWIVQVIQRFFSKLPNQTRFNLFLNFLLFLDMVLVSYSGVVISEAALPTMGIPVVIDPFWGMLHDLTGNLFLVLIGVHIAMHWKWIVTNLKKYVWGKRPLNTPIGEQ